MEEFQHQMGSGLAAVAKEMTESITDPSIKSTEASFMGDGTCIYLRVAMLHYFTYVCM